MFPVLVFTLFGCDTHIFFYFYFRCLYIIAAAKYGFIDGGFQTYYNSLPLYHVTGGLMCLGIVLIFGGKMVIRKKFSASNFWKDAVKHKATVK